MALTSPQKTRLFNYLLRGFAGLDPLVVLRAVFDALFLTPIEQRNWILARTAQVKTQTQTLHDGVDTRATSDKTALTAEINDITTLETNL